MRNTIRGTDMGTIHRQFFLGLWKRIPQLLFFKVNGFIWAVLIRAERLDSTQLQEDMQRMGNPRVGVKKPSRIAWGVLLPVVVPMVYSAGMKLYDRIHTHLEQVQVPQTWFHHLNAGQNLINQRGMIWGFVYEIPNKKSDWLVLCSSHLRKYVIQIYKLVEHEIFTFVVCTIATDFIFGCPNTFPEVKRFEFDWENEWPVSCIVVVNDNLIVSMDSQKDCHGQPCGVQQTFHSDGR